MACSNTEVIFQVSGPEFWTHAAFQLIFWFWTHQSPAHAGFLVLGPWFPNTCWIETHAFEPMNPQHKLDFWFWTHESPAQTGFLVLNPWIPNTYWTSGFEPTNPQHTLNLNWMLVLKLKTVSTEENIHCWNVRLIQWVQSMRGPAGEVTIYKWCDSQGHTVPPKHLCPKN